MGYGGTATSNNSEQRAEQKKKLQSIPLRACGVGRADFVTILAPAVYLVLYTLYDLLAAKSAQSHGGFYLFEPACVVLIVETGKLLASLFLIFVTRPGMPSSSQLKSCATGLSISAVCYASINIINLVSLAKVSLSQYGIWYQMGIFFNAVLWYVVFRRPFGTRRTIAILVLFLGCCVNSIRPGFHVKFEGAVLLVVLTSLISAVGCVLNEYYYKRDATIDINVQNSVLYLETSLFCLGLIAAIHPERLSSTASFFRGFQGDCWQLILIQIFIGLTVSRILKYTSIITKNYVMALHVPIEVVMAHRFLGTPLTTMTFVSALLIGFSTVLYFTPIPSASDSAKEKLGLTTGKEKKSSDSV